MKKKQEGVGTWAPDAWRGPWAYPHQHNKCTNVDHECVWCIAYTVTQIRMMYMHRHTHIRTCTHDANTCSSIPTNPHHHPTPYTPTSFPTPTNPPTPNPPHPHHTTPTPTPHLFSGNKPRHISIGLYITHSTIRLDFIHTALDNTAYYKLC